MKININFAKGFGDTLIATPVIKQLKEIGYDIAVTGVGAREIFFNSPDCHSHCHTTDERTYIPQDILIKQANQRPIHQIEYPFAYFNLALGLNLINKYNHCFLYLTDKEKEEKQLSKPFILLNSEYQNNFTTKKYHRWQEVVDSLKDMIDIVQIGLRRDYTLKNTHNLTGMLNLRQVIVLAYNSVLCLGGESLLNHVASAFNKPSIVVASGFSPKNYYSYASTTIINKSFALPCGSSGACWKTRIQHLYDRSPNDNQICVDAIKVNETDEKWHSKITKCMSLIDPMDIVTACLDYL